jgi:glycine cleavage system H protein
VSSNCHSIDGSNHGDEELLYAETHEWLHLAEQNGDKIATIGISAFAVEALTDLVYIQLPEVGQKVSVGESFGEVESVKAVSDLYSPIEGEVIEVNESLANDLEALSTDPYGKGWVAKIKLTDEGGLANLLDIDSYRKQCSDD